MGMPLSVRSMLDLLPREDTAATTIMPKRKGAATIGQPTNEIGPISDGHKTPLVADQASPTEGPAAGDSSTDTAVIQSEDLESTVEGEEQLSAVARRRYTDIFKRASMDFLDRELLLSGDEQSEDSIDLSKPPSFLGLPFGPPAMIFEPSEEYSPSSSVVVGGERRHSVMTYGQDDLPRNWTAARFHVDDYFTPPQQHQLQRGGGGCYRRHSVAAETMSYEPLSTLSPVAPSFQAPETVPLSARSMQSAAFQLSSYKGPLYTVEFKAGRTEIFYVLEVDGRATMKITVGDLVIVEADRGEDLGKVTTELSLMRLKQLISGTTEKDELISPEIASLLLNKEIIPKRIHRLAHADDFKMVQAKSQEEALAMVRCQSRIRQKRLPMEVVDAEYQWDRNKLTFYFCADRRIDFRELVRDLFRIYKTRIWMCAIDKNNASKPMILSPGAGCISSGIYSPVSCYETELSQVPLSSPLAN